MTEPFQKGLGRVQKPGPDERKKAAKVVAHHSKDEEECRTFLKMLGFNTKDKKGKRK